MTVLHINSSARQNHSDTPIIGQHLVDALMTGLYSNDIEGAA